MWEVTLISKRTVEGERPFECKDKITFMFDTVLSMTNFIEAALKKTTDTVEVNIKYLESKEGEE